MRRGWRFGVHVADRDAAIALLNADHLGVVLNEIADLLCERLPDHVHAADGLKHGGLELMQGEILQISPKPRFQDVRQVDGLAGDRRGTQAAAGVLGVAAIVRRNKVGLVGIVFVERAPGPQRLQQNLPVFHRHRFVELALLRHLGEQFRNMALKIRLDVTNALRLAGERIRSVEQGVMIELDEGFEGDAEALAIIEQGTVMIRNSPRSRIEIKAFLEAAPRIVQLRPPGRLLNSSTWTL